MMHRAEISPIVKVSSGVNLCVNFSCEEETELFWRSGVPDQLIQFSSLKLNQLGKVRFS